MRSITQSDVRDSLPDLEMDISLALVDGSITIIRDSLGIPHIRANTTHDAFFGQGFAIAQDRLWQMDFDRHRAEGRSAKLLGESGLDWDTLVRRMGIASSARADYETVNKRTKEMLDAYAEGVNAFIASMKKLPIEYQLLDIEPDPWQSFDCLSVAKIRHVFMGNFEFKLWRAKLLAKIGPELTAQLFPASDPGGLVIIPPGGIFAGEESDGREVLHASADMTGLFATVRDDEGTDAGSNSWVLGGSRTAGGLPLLAGDPHRAPDTPNVYVQNHITSPEFDAIGLSFAGLPGFIHFGHNRHVAWCVTHASADYQDLYIEKLLPGDPPTYEYRNQHITTQTRRETIEVRGGKSVEIEITTTHHGPLIMGSTDNGFGIALKHTALVEPEPWAEALFDMLIARDVNEFESAMRHWVDPCNSMMCADVTGNISYQMRGKLPIRSRQNSWVPVPGWDGEHEWSGRVPFEENPRLRNPAGDLIVTANNRIIGPPYSHYVSMDFAPDFRARRILDRLSNITGATTNDMASIHTENISIPAQQLKTHLLDLTPSNELAERALQLLGSWDCSMDRERSEPTIYSAIVTALLRRISTHLVGEKLTEEAMNGTDRGGPAHLRGLKMLFMRLLQGDDLSLLPQGETWESVLTDAVTEAIQGIREALGDDIEQWQWGVLHRTRHTHVLSGWLPNQAHLLNPPTVACSGDADTPLQGAFAPGRPFTVYSTSVARYIYDLSNWNNSQWIVPLGSSGHPGSPHYSDQMQRWASVELYPMLYEWDSIQSDAETTQTIRRSSDSS